MPEGGARAIASRGEVPGDDELLDLIKPFQINLPASAWSEPLKKILARFS